MNILAIETSTQACSAALLYHGQIVHRFQIAPRAHGDLILSMANELLLEADLGPTQLTAVAFGRGPGAFTGVRIATAVAQGIAFAADLPVVPVSTLAALAQAGYRHSGYQAMLCAMDARMGEVYWGAYQVNQGMVSLLADELVCPPGAVPQPRDNDWHGIGNGWTVFAQELQARVPLKIEEKDTVLLPRAEEVAMLAQHAVINGQMVAPEQALPVYLRDDVAEKTKK